MLIYWIFYAFASASFTQLGLSVFLFSFSVSLSLLLLFRSYTKPVYVFVVSSMDHVNPFFALFDLIKASSDAIFPFALVNPIFLLFSHHFVYSFLCIKTFSSSSTFAKCSWNVILVNAHKALLYLNVCVCVVFGIYTCVFHSLSLSPSFSLYFSVCVLCCFLFVCYAIFKGFSENLPLKCSMFKNIGTRNIYTNYKAEQKHLMKT